MNESIFTFSPIDSATNERDYENVMRWTKGSEVITREKMIRN